MNESNSIDASETISVALLDDNKYMLLGMEAELSRDANIDVVFATGYPNDFVKFVLENEPDVACIDLNIEGDSSGGFSVIETIRESSVSTKCMIHTLGDDVNNLIKARHLDVLVLGIIVERPNSRGQQPQLAELIRKTHRGEPYFPIHLLDDALEVSKVRQSSPRLQIDFTGINRSTDKIKLTDAEKNVLALVGQGFSNKDIGSKLHITVSTVKTHVSNILRKLEANDRDHAFLIALKQDLLDES